jgi:hypothetical protein
LLQIARRHRRTSCHAESLRSPHAAAAHVHAHTFQHHSIQLSLLLAILLAFFLLTSHGADVRLGMYHLYFRRYRYLLGGKRACIPCNEHVLPGDWKAATLQPTAGARPRRYRSAIRPTRAAAQHRQQRASARPLLRCRGFYLAAALAVCSFTGVGLYRLVLANANMPSPLVWQRPAFHALWVAERACLLAFQCAAARAAALSLRPPSEPWLAAAEASLQSPAG